MRQLGALSVSRSGPKLAHGAGRMAKTEKPKSLTVEGLLTLQKSRAKLHMLTEN